MEFLYYKYNIKPFLKWVGGKRSLLDSLTMRLPKTYDTYCELFLGGGALFLHLCPSKAIVNDINSELINLYIVIRDNVEGLIENVKQFKDDEETYYKIRDWDQNIEFYNSLSNVERASRILYMNRVCFNGVYRVNAKGYFNVPYAKYGSKVGRRQVDFDNLYKVSEYFNDADIQFLAKDIHDIEKFIPDNSFVYLDPPYDPVSVTASFTTYAKAGFNREDQIFLKEFCDRLSERNIFWLESNSATDFIKELYQGYTIDIVKAPRSINSNGKGRGKVEEIVIYNYTEEQFNMFEEKDKEIDNIVVEEENLVREKDMESSVINEEKSNKKKKVEKQSTSISLDKSLYNKLKEYLTKNNIKMSKWIEDQIRNLDIVEDNKEGIIEEEVIESDLSKENESFEIDKNIESVNFDLIELKIKIIKEIMERCSKYNLSCNIKEALLILNSLGEE